MFVTAIKREKRGIQGTLAIKTETIQMQTQTILCCSEFLPSSSFENKFHSLDSQGGYRRKL